MIHAIRASSIPTRQLSLTDHSSLWAHRFWSGQTILLGPHSHGYHYQRDPSTSILAHRLWYTLKSLNLPHFTGNDPKPHCRTSIHNIVAHEWGTGTESYGKTRFAIFLISPPICLLCPQWLHWNEGSSQALHQIVPPCALRYSGSPILFIHCLHVQHSSLGSDLLWEVEQRTTTARCKVVWEWCSRWWWQNCSALPVNYLLHHIPWGKKHFHSSYNGWEAQF